MDRVSRAPRPIGSSTRENAACQRLDQPAASGACSSRGLSGDVVSDVSCVFDRTLCTLERRIRASDWLSGFECAQNVVGSLNYPRIEPPEVETRSAADDGPWNMRLGVRNNNGNIPDDPAVFQHPPLPPSPLRRGDIPRRVSISPLFSHNRNTQTLRL